MTYPAKNAFATEARVLEAFGFKLSDGGSHISRTMMLAELEILLAVVPSDAGAADYRDAIVSQNALGKPTESTRSKSLRHLRELYALDPSVPIFAALRRLYALDPDGLPLLALLVAWARDPLLRATTPAIAAAREGERVDPVTLAREVHAAFTQYSEPNCQKIARNTASSWTQSGHLVGRTNKVRRTVKPTSVAVTLALFLGEVAGFHGAVVFTNPWCRLLDLDADRARALALAAHRADLLNLRAIGDVVELHFPSLADLLQPVV